MNLKRNLAIAGLSGAILLTGACGGSSEPTGVDSFGGSTETTSTEASTCDVAREALLTGSETDIASALSALQADSSADATAREYADYYLNRDAGNPDLREMDVSLIRTACSS
jgi:hypothetical protein